MWTKGTVSQLYPHLMFDGLVDYKHLLSFESLKTFLLYCTDTMEAESACVTESAERKSDDAKHVEYRLLKKIPFHH